MADINKQNLGILAMSGIMNVIAMVYSKSCTMEFTSRIPEYSTI